MAESAKKGTKMRTFDLTKRNPAIEEINSILKNNCIAELTISKIQRMMNIQYTLRTITILMMDMGIDFQEQKYRFIDDAIMNAIANMKPIDLSYDNIATVCPFEIAPRNVCFRLKAMGRNIEKDRDDFIKNNLIDILNHSEDIPRYKYPSLLRSREAYQSPPTVRGHLDDIRDIPSWRSRLKNPDHPALTKRYRCKIIRSPKD